MRADRLEDVPPEPVLEGRLGDDRHAAMDEDAQDVREDRDRADGERIAVRRLEGAAGRVHHPLLDLVAADGRRADLACKRMRERRLTGGGEAAHDHERGREGRRLARLRPDPHVVRSTQAYDITGAAPGATSPCAFQALFSPLCMYA